MAEKEKKTDKYSTSDGYAYLTKRTIVSKAKAAGRKAEADAMELMGYVVVVMGDWVVKKYQDGTVVNIRKIK